MTDLSNRAAYIHAHIRNAGPMTLDEIHGEFETIARTLKNQPIFFKADIHAALLDLQSRGMAKLDGELWEMLPERKVEAKAGGMLF